jgi:HTH-type transcriptional regulator/antitoxin HigA
MHLRPIHHEKDHRAALAEIEKLWGAASGTPEGDKLDIFVTLVETYEERAAQGDRPGSSKRRRTRSQSGAACGDFGFSVACLRSPGSSP